ncbi:hypothetical protein M885DRAFT_527490 [Pelagophyceae sp. CCMP2097]|nr:hypothetical protein M885DRAFT_527490 [Pelagophyceae sp. CCMP2097]|mmetsp:Transcript_15578/g.52519  ORF Transcript_15578/g.52519 Transcript_15578/m.52519 type:complete len:207 (-) Transcript_15578:101-721(-)
MPAMPRFTLLLCAWLRLFASAQETAGEAVAPEADGAEANATAAAICPLTQGAFDDRFAVAQLLIAQKNLPQAEACLTAALAHALGAVRQLSDIAAVSQQPARAATFSSILETLAPRDGESIMLHAQRLGQAGRWAEALPRLAELRGANDNNAIVANTYGTALYWGGEVKEAAVQFEHALSIEPDNKDYLENLNAANEKIAEVAKAV